MFALNSCTTADDMGYNKYTINIKLVDGSWKTQYYKLPKGTYFFIRGYEGSYSLEYRNSECGSIECSGTLKEAAIDFEIIGVKPYTY